MTVAVVTLFLALLALTAQVAVAGGVVLGVGGRVSPSLGDLAERARAALAPSALKLGFLVAAVAMAGSLYLSEVADFPPCRLCWYQRIAIYPLVPLLGLAAFRKDGANVVPFAIALPVLGMPISAYHMLVERFPNLETSVCDLANPCSTMWVDRLGYLTIPTMALTAQAAIVGLLLVARSGG